MANWDTTQTGAGVLDTTKGNEPLFQDLAPVLAKIQPQIKTIAYTNPLWGEYQSKYPTVLAKYGYSNPGSIDAWDVLATSVGLPVLTESQGVKWSWEFRPTSSFTGITDYTKGENWVVSGYKPSASGGSIIDFAFKDLVNFLNPITATKAITNRFSESPSTGITSFIENLINPPKLNPTQELIKGITNVIGTVGFAFGVEGVSQSISAYASATTPLATGVQGPVNPGFWSTLSSGNFTGAWDILASPISSVYHSPSPDSTIVGLSKTTALGQIVNEFVELTGKIGKGVVQILSGNFSGVLKTFGGNTTPPSTTPISINPFGNFQSGGGGSGLGVGSGGTGQTTTNPLVFPAIAFGILAVLWLVMRKK